MKLVFIVLFLWSVMAFGEDQVQSEVSADKVSQNQEVSPQEEVCSFVTGLWYFTKLYAYDALICPKMHTDDASIKQCVWEEMKTAFSSPDAMETYLESFNFLDENSLSSSARTLIGNLGDVQAEQCGNLNENMDVEEIKKLLSCGLKVVNNKKAELKCRK